MPLSGFWVGVANLVVERPASDLDPSASSALTPLAVDRCADQAELQPARRPDADRPSVVGAKIIQRYFAVGELGTTSLLIEHPTIELPPGSGPRRDGQREPARSPPMPNVAEVRSVSQPLGKPGKPAAAKDVPRTSDRTGRCGAAVDSRYVSISPAIKPPTRDHITRIDVVFKTDPFSDASLHALGGSSRRPSKTLRQPGQPLAGATAFGMTGPTATVDDLAR